MIKSELSVVIDAPPEKVFARVSNPLNSMEDVPNVVDVRDVVGEGEGQSCHMVYKMVGVRVELEFTVAEYIPNEQVTFEFKGGSNGRQTWKLTPQDGGCRLDVFGEYTIPVPLVGRMAELMLKRHNDREWEAMLANIKARVESDTRN